MSPTCSIGRLQGAFLTRRIPVGNLELDRAFLADLDRVLQRMDLFQVPGVSRINERMNSYRGVARVPTFSLSNIQEPASWSIAGTQ
jgi:hypothetical protein